ncbi:hypothetical protein Q7C36_010998 [Tachysurus vachellii]|uniref:Uncharacterized protein n=1 Tax=Tachysurus vachellii TaxID=175792 RepID=A0AA88N068_TACVA|nr:hypothetical protein Q7C36_010998 [Tachysurus vachellii]
MHLTYQQVASDSVPVSSLILYSLHHISSSRTYQCSVSGDQVGMSVVLIVIVVLQQLIYINICSCYQLLPSHHAPQTCFPFLLACCLITGIINTTTNNIITSTININTTTSNTTNIISTIINTTTNIITSTININTTTNSNININTTNHINDNINTTTYTTISTPPPTTSTPQTTSMFNIKH